MGARRSFAAAALVAIASCRCDNGQGGGAAIDAAVRSDAETRADSGGRALALDAGAKASPPPCRMLAAAGDVRLDGDAGAKLAAPAALRGGVEGVEGVDGPWLDLGVATKISVKAPTSGRETAFDGPGRVRPCASGEEEAWVASGKFTSSPGTGARPGGEQWVVTPLAIVRYGVQLVTISVSDGAVDVSSAEGARVWVAGEAKSEADDGWQSVRGKATFKRGATLGDAAIVARCAQVADRAGELATQIARPDAALSDLAPRHILARQLARAACAVARLRAFLAPAGANRDVWMQSVDTADARWRSL